MGQDQSNERQKFGSHRSVVEFLLNLILLRGRNATHELGLINWLFFKTYTELGVGCPLRQTAQLWASCVKIWSLRNHVFKQNYTVKVKAWRSPETYSLFHTYSIDWNRMRSSEANASRVRAQSNVIWNVLIFLGHIYNYKPYLMKEKCCRNKEILPVWPRLVLNSSSSTANIIPELLFCPPMISITRKPTIQAVHEQPSSKRAFTE